MKDFGEILLYRYIGSKVPPGVHTCKLLFICGRHRGQEWMGATMYVMVLS